MQQLTENALYLARNWQPDVDMILENGIAAFGLKGSGKSNLVALLVEQISRFLVPCIVFDTEHEYESLLPSLPHGARASADCLPAASAILSRGLQVVVNLQSWERTEDAASAIVALVNDLLTYTRNQAPADRVPCAIHLDEAGYWLPQKPVSYLSKETRLDLLSTFALLGSRGRKYGLTPFLYAQQISQVDKDAIRQAGLHILMRQTQDNDIRRYGEYVKLTPERKQEIASFEKGEAVVHGLPNGSAKHVFFNERVSEHTSHTPRARAAIAKFADLRDEYDSLAQMSTLPTKGVQSASALLAGYVTIEEVGELVGRSRSAIYRAMRANHIKPVRGVHADHSKPVAMISSGEAETIRKHLIGM